MFDIFEEVSVKKTKGDWDRWISKLAERYPRFNAIELADIILNVLQTCPTVMTWSIDGELRQNRSFPDTRTEEAVAVEGWGILPELAQPALLTDEPGYERLRATLEAAYDQAARGKGAVRHGNSLPFHEQPMQTIARQVGPGFILGQAMKKIGESAGLDKDAAIRELLGAIVYCAGAVIFLTDH